MINKTLATDYRDYAKESCELMQNITKLTEKDSLHKCLVKYYIPDDHDRIERILVKFKRSL